MAKRIKSDAETNSANQTGDVELQKKKVTTQEEVAPLSKTEKAELKKHEKEVEQHKEGFFKMAAALIAIKDEQLYREEAKTFEAYCEKRFDFKRGYAYKLIQGGEVQNELIEMGAPKVSNESQARVLRLIESKEERGDVMHKAQEIAGEGKEILGAHLTAAINEIKPEMRGKGTSSANKNAASRKIDNSRIEKWLETILTLHKRLVDDYEDSDNEIATLAELKAEIEAALGIESKEDNIIDVESEVSDAEDSAHDPDEEQEEADESEDDEDEESDIKDAA